MISFRLFQDILLRMSILDGSPSDFSYFQSSFRFPYIFIKFSDNKTFLSCF